MSIYERSQRAVGFTFIEVIIVMALVVMLAGLVSGISMRTMNRRLANSQVEMLLSTLATQQQRAANRVLNGESTQSYGVYFFTTGYTVFAGSTYQAGKVSNQTTHLPSGVTFSTINLPNNQVVFAEATGFVQGFVATQSAVVLRDQVGKQTTLTINRLGVVEN